MAGGKGSPAPNICQGMPGARKYRPGVTLPGHNVGCPQPTGSWLSVPLKGVKTAGSQQCTMLPSAPQGPDGIAGTQWRCDPPHAMLSPPNPPETARLCGLLPPPAPIELSRDWDAQSGLTSGGGGGGCALLPQGWLWVRVWQRGVPGVPWDTVGCVALIRQWGAITGVTAFPQPRKAQGLLAGAPLPSATRSLMLDPKPQPPEQHPPPSLAGAAEPFPAADAESLQAPPKHLAGTRPGVVPGAGGVGEGAGPRRAGAGRERSRSGAAAAAGQGPAGRRAGGGGVRAGGGCACACACVCGAAGSAAGGPRRC